MTRRLPDFLEGAVDLHVHSAPDVDRRRYDDLELAREARHHGQDGGIGILDRRGRLPPVVRHGPVFFERCFVCTVADNPPPVEGLRLYSARLRSTGFSTDQIRTMMQANPELLLNQPPPSCRKP